MAGMHASFVPRRFFTTRPGARLSFALAAAALLTLSLAAGAYDQYSSDRNTGNCAECHGNFRATAPYVSLSDGVSWRDPSNAGAVNLHDGHRSVMLSLDCNACHSGGSRFPVLTNISAGGTGLAPISCLGCHGRAEPAAGGAVTGSGLRQEHVRAGVSACANAACHDDGNPGSFTPVNEHAFPPYYAMPDAAHPGKPANPCDIGGSESAVAPPLGLDNDGDGVYDEGEPECDVSPVRADTWGRIKLLYRD